MSSLAQPRIAPHRSVTVATTTTAVCAIGRELEDEVGPDHEVDAGGDHRRGVDEGRDRGRALHRVEQPRLQRHLRGLAARAEQEQQAERVERALARLAGQLADGAEVGGAEGREHQRDRQREADVTDTVDDERLLGGGSGRRLVLPEADEQVRRQADALPAQEQAHEVGRQDQREHRGDEQVEVAEEAAATRVVLHVADGVDVDQRADAGDQEQEQRGQLVVEQVHADGRASRSRTTSRGAGRPGATRRRGPAA